MHLIFNPHIEDISDIKLIRTDTTLDLSQKAEKRWPTSVWGQLKILAHKLLVVVPCFLSAHNKGCC